jgi:hypothetical protein
MSTRYWCWKADISSAGAYLELPLQMDHQANEAKACVVCNSMERCCLRKGRAHTSNADQTRAPGYCRQPKEGSFERHPTSESPCSGREELAYSRQYPFIHPPTASLFLEKSSPPPQARHRDYTSYDLSRPADPGKLRPPRASHETKIAQQHTAMDGESREERDARIRALWEQLDTKKKGNVDLPALRHGLEKMNHRESLGGSGTRTTLKGLQRSKMRTIWSRRSCMPPTSIRMERFPMTVCTPVA